MEIYITKPLSVFEVQALDKTLHILQLKGKTKIIMGDTVNYASTKNQHVLQVFKELEILDTNINIKSLYTHIKSLM